MTMRQTMRAALVAGGVVILGVAVTPAVAAVYHRPPEVGPVSVVTESFEDVGPKGKLCGDDGPMAEMMRRAGAGSGPEMATMHRAHHRNGGGSLAGMGAMHRAHHGAAGSADDNMMDEDMMDEDMMNGGGMAEMMDDPDHMSSGGGSAG